MRLLSHRFALRIAITMLALALLAFGLLNRAPHRLAIAPQLPRTAVRGPLVTVADLRGHAEAILFYASWCTPCRNEAPAVERFARSSEGRGRLLAVDYDDYGNVRGFIVRYHWTFPVLSDPKGNTGDAYGVSGGLPTWVFLNARGDIVARESGAQSVASLDRALSDAS